MGWAIALQGGAGDIPRTLPAERRETREAALRHFLAIGVDALKAGKSPLDVVELVVHKPINTTLCVFYVYLCLTLLFSCFDRGMFGVHKKVVFN
jgi:hypothetical protein